MLKFGQFVTKHKKIILIIAIILLIPSILGMKATRTNYNILAYLPSDLETVQGQDVLADDFHRGAYAILVVDNMPSKDILKLEDKIKKVSTVKDVASVADATGTSIPKEALPDEIKNKIYSGDETIIFVTFENAISDDQTMDAVSEIKKIAGTQCKVSGMTATLLDTKDLSDREVSIYVLIAVALCLLILQLALDSYFAPFLILINIGIAILYNMGTNIMFGEISYITKAISAVLQLGVTMDFAIFLYHSYLQEKETAKDNDEAMSIAIGKTMTSVLGSATTTIAGFLALCTMRLTLGKDIGLVMAKGVLFGLICVITVLPALILIFDKAIQKTRHKALLPKFEHLKNFNIKHYKAIAVIFLIMVPFAVWGYSHTQSYYNLDGDLPKDLPSVEANTDVKDKFHVVTAETLLIDKNMPEYKVEEMLEKIDKIDGIRWTLSYTDLLGTSVPVDSLPDSIKSIFIGSKYQMIIIDSDYELATDELTNQISEINKIIKEYDNDAILAGEGPLMNDLVEIADHDFNSVNYVSMAVIFIIMIINLKSFALPILLMIAIEFAIFINMGIPAYTGTKLPFVASIVIGTIQLGATIDYAILITTKYIGERKAGKDKFKAIDYALGTSINSVAVSALCFFGATFGVGIYSEIAMISSLCILMARGALISGAVVITVLPAFLLIFDKWICKTTKGLTKIKA
jgi:predicted RND superfamily exporter protein